MFCALAVVGFEVAHVGPILKGTTEGFGPRVWRRVHRNIEA